MKVVLGIGNPGRRYEATRHNVGFRVIDRVAASVGAEIGKRRLKALVGEGTADGERLLLVKPQTYVNLVGECARAVLDYFGIGVDSLLVVTDDVNLPLGTLRCRSEGSSGGHNGLDSLIRHLGTSAFARLRVGVGRPFAGHRQSRGPALAEGAPAAGLRREAGELVGHVLGRFPEEEKRLAERAEARAAEAVLVWARCGVEECQNRFNRPEDSGRAPPEGEREKP